MYRGLGIAINADVTITATHDFSSSQNSLSNSLTQFLCTKSSNQQAIKSSIHLINPTQDEVPLDP
jgi:hypothetical protein